YRYYVHQEFTFENTPLPRVFEILGKAYQKKFLIEDPKIKALTYTATFEQQNLNEIIDVILRTFSLKISKKDEAYYINLAVYVKILGLYQTVENYPIYYSEIEAFCGQRGDRYF